jgi:hypothetical protein
VENGSSSSGDNKHHKIYGSKENGEIDFEEEPRHDQNNETYQESDDNYLLQTVEEEEYRGLEQKNRND